MPDVEVLGVDEERLLVEIRAGNIIAVFFKDPKGAIRTSLRYSYDTTDMYIPDDLYDRAVRMAAGVIADREARKRKKANMKKGTRIVEKKIPFPTV